MLQQQLRSPYLLPCQEALYHGASISVVICLAKSGKDSFSPTKKNWPLEALFLTLVGIQKNDQAHDNVNSKGANSTQRSRIRLFGITHQLLTPLLESSQ